MVVAVNTAVDPELEATHPRDMSVALRALRNHAGADSSASFDDHGREQTLGIIPASLEPVTLSSESKPLPTRFFIIAEATIDHNRIEHDDRCGNNDSRMTLGNSKLSLMSAHGLGLNFRWSASPHQSLSIGATLSLPRHNTQSEPSLDPCAPERR